MDINENQKFRRAPFWYLKFLLACYACAIALFMVAIIASLPLGANEFILDHAGVVLLVFTIATSPIMYRYLR